MKMRQSALRLPGDRPGSSPRRAGGSRVWLLLAAVLPAALVLAACPGGGRPEKGATSALWVEPGELSHLETPLLSRLAEAGIREVFIPVAELDLASGEGPLVRQPMPELEPSLKVNLVVGGKLQLGGADPRQAAVAVGEAVEQLLFDVEARGIVPAGVHFDLRSIDSVEVGAAFFKKLRGALDPSFFLSISLRRSWMKHPEIRSLAKATDFVVPFLYGQRYWEIDSKEAWDFDVVEERLEQLEEFEVPYMVGIIGIGNATHKGKDGSTKAFSSKQSLSPFLWNHDLKLRRGFTLHATDRRVYTLIAERATQAGGWDIAPEDEIRLVRPVTTDLDGLLQILAAGDYPHLLGELYYRLPAPEERMSITVENILTAVSDEPVVPDLDFAAEVTRRTRRGLAVRFTVANLSAENTELSLLDNNYLQITADENAFGRVDRGEFYRYELGRLGPDGKLERAFRNANVLRFQVPILEAGQRVTGGEVEIRGRNPTFQLQAKFMMPDGRIVDFGPYTWRDGELHGLPQREEETELEGEEGEGAEGAAADG